MRIDSLLLAIAVVLWGVEITRYTRAVGHARGGTSWRAAVGGVTALLAWWWYLRANDPSYVSPADLFRSHLVEAGGGTIATSQYIWFLTLAATLGAMFVFTGHFVSRRTGFLGTRELTFQDCGLFYYVGMAVFLMLQVGGATLSGNAYYSAIVLALAFGVASLVTVRRERVLQRTAGAVAQHIDVLLLVLPLITIVSCLLQYVVTRRGGPFYEDVVRHVVATHQMPLVNRHFGQSVLASTVGFVVGPGPDSVTFPRALINNWLYLSQVALFFVLFRVLKTLEVSRRGCFYGVVALMAGNCALSLLPHILYDHDFPLLMNVYTDSLFGIAGWLILVLHLLHRAGTAASQSRAAHWLPTLVVPATIVMVFNYTSELNIPLTFCLLLAAVILAFARGQADVGVGIRELAAMLLTFAIAAWTGALQGGVFAQDFAGAARKSASPLWELDASRARMSITQPQWWYLPHVVLGFSTGFGNAMLPAEAVVAPAAAPDVEAARAINESSNQPLLQRFAANRPAGAARYSNVIYLAERRLGEVVRVLWFPLAGLIAVGVMVLAPRRIARPSEESMMRLQRFWIISATTFALGLGGVVLTNAVGGNALFWKWALTRIVEPGLGLAMIAWVVGVDRFVQQLKSPGRGHIVWVALLALMTFATWFRIFGYPSFNG